MSTILKGNLKKLGEKGPRKTWKKRFFIQRGNKLYYYVSEKSAQEKGFINLEEAITIERTEKPSHSFRINTPKRIYYLQAENEEQAEYWITGAGKCINTIHQSNDNQHSLHDIDSRISELENQNSKLKNILEYVAKQLHTSVDHITHSFEAGEPFKVGDISEDKKEPVIHNIEIIEEQKQEGAKEVKEVEEKKEESSEEKPEEKEEKKEEKVEEKADVAGVAENNQSSNDEPTILEAKEMKLNEEEAAQKNEVSSDSDSDDSDVEDDGKKNDSHFGAQVLFEYSARKNYELSISVNEVITVLSKHENGWWLGCNSKGVQGYFPGSYVRPID